MKTDNLSAILLISKMGAGAILSLPILSILFAISLNQPEQPKESPKTFTVHKTVFNTDSILYATYEEPGSLTLVCFDGGTKVRSWQSITELVEIADLEKINGYTAVAPEKVCVEYLEKRKKIVKTTYENFFISDYFWNSNLKRKIHECPCDNLIAKIWL